MLKFKTSTLNYIMVVLLMVLCLAFTFSWGDNILTDDGTETVAAPSGNWTTYRASSFAGGNGNTSTNPYEISTPEQLAYLAYLINSSSTSVYNEYKDKYYRITASLDMSAHYWTPIGNSLSRAFSGHINSRSYQNGYEISGINNYNTRTSSYQGLFGYVSGATIARVAVVNSTIYGVSYVGAIVGYATDTTTIDQCYSTATVIGTGDNIGGIVGCITDENDGGEVSSCYFRGSVQGGSYVGGIAGGTFLTYVYSCYNAGTVTGDDYIGGIVGRASQNIIQGTYSSVDSMPINTRIYNCFNVGSISTSKQGNIYLGGIAGYVQNTIVRNCYHAGSLTIVSSTTQSTYVGQIAGRVELLDDNPVNIENYELIYGCKYSNSSYLYSSNGNINIGGIGYAGGASGSNPGSTYTSTSSGVFDEEDFYGSRLKTYFTWTSAYNEWGQSGVWVTQTNDYPRLSRFSTLYYITYYEEGGTLTGSFPTSVYAGSVIEITNPIAPTGYVFMGWTAEGLNTSTAMYGSSSTRLYNWTNGNSARTETYFRDLTTPGLRVYLTATYQPISYTIEFNCGSYAQSNPSSTTVNYDSNVTINNLTAKEGSGHYFTGWKALSGLSTTTAMTGTSTSNFVSWDGSPTTNRYFKNLRYTTGSVTLVAQWEAETYTINYDTKGGTGPTRDGVTVTSDSFTYGEELELPVANLSGQVFIGWSYNGVTYSDSIENVDLGNDGATVTFEAVYGELQYNVTIVDEFNGGDTYTYNYSDLVSINIPTADGYTFAGWDLSGDVDMTGGRQGTTSTPNATLTDPTNSTSTRFMYLSSTNGGTVTFTAIYEPIQYKIYVMYNNGTQISIPPNYVDYGEVFTTEIPTYDAYHSFAGWGISSDTLAFNQDTARYGAGSTANSTFTLDSGYYMTNDSATSFKNLTTTNGGSIIILALWEGIDITVLLNGNGGLVGGTTANVFLRPNMEYGGTTNNKLTSNYLSTRENYIFQGYYDAMSGGVKIYDEEGNAVRGTKYWDNSGRWIFGDGAIVLYAQWEGEPYEIQFFNSRTKSSDYVDAKFGEVVVYEVPEDDPPYKFLRWAVMGNYFDSETARYGTNSTPETPFDYISGDYYTNSTANRFLNLSTTGGTVILFSQWEIQEVEVTLNSTEGKFTDGYSEKTLSMIYQQGDNFSISAEYIPVRDGYTFEGYFTIGGTQVYDRNGNAILGTSYWNTSGQWIGTEPLTIYAEWEEITYSIIFRSAAGHADVLVNNITYEQVVTVDLPEWEGYDFTGWLAEGINTSTALYGENDEPDKSFIDNMTSSLANKFKRLTTTDGAQVILTGQREPKTYTVYLDANGGDVSPSTLEVKYLGTYGENNRGELPEPTRAGFIFRGWYTDLDNDEQILASTQYTLTDDSTIYAQWVDTWSNHASDDLETEGSYYIVSSEEDLARVSKLINDTYDTSVLDMNIRLTSNLDMSAYVWAPIGTPERAYSGKFEGNGHIITGIRNYYNSNIPEVYSYVGLFGYTDGATIENLFVRDVDIIGGSFVGGIVGQAMGSTNINGCAFSGTITSNSTATRGALVGYGENTVRINDCMVFTANTRNGIAGGNCTVVTCVYIINGTRGYIGSDFSNYVYVSGMTAPVSKGLSWLAQGGEPCTLTDIQNWANGVI